MTEKQAHDRRATDPLRRAIWTFCVLSALGFIATMSVAITGIAQQRQVNRAQDDARLDDAIASCERGNRSRADINHLADAIVIGNETKRLLNEADGQVARAFVAALTPPEGLDAEAQAIADAFLADVDAIAARVEQTLHEAETLVAEARLSMRDCSPDVVLVDPNATIPDPVEES